MSVERWWSDTDRGKLKYWENKLCTTNLAWPDLAGIKL